MNKSSFKEISMLTIKLFFICFVVSALLALVNSVTEPVIRTNEQKSFAEAMKQLLPEADNFEEVKDLEFLPTESGVSLESLYKGVKDGELCGYVASTVCSEGYGGDINVMVSITGENKVGEIKIMSISETAGLGAKANTPEFLAQYQGLKADIGVKKNNGGSVEENTISAISGATITSKAVTKAVNCAIEATKAGGAANE